jgi:amidophosphoribosyltransferase
MQVKDVVAVITGGASGLGRATAERLLSQGAKVVLVDLPTSAGAEVARELGDRAAFCAADVTDEAQMQAAFDLAESMGEVRVTVHCAGRGGALRILDKQGNPGSLEHYASIVNLNLVGSFNVLRLAAARMAKLEPIEGERGVVIMTASIAAFEGQIGQIPYASSKAGVVGMTLVAARDPNGFRPLCLGKLEDGYVVASETCALDLIDASFLRQVEPGEVVFIDKKGLRSIKPFKRVRHAHCIFEFIYFARPDSNIFGQNVYQVRKRQGAQLAKENEDIKADFVMPFPDSGVYAALGYAAASGLPFEMGMIRNHYVGRTFIQPSQDMRSFGVRVKLNPVKELIQGKRVVIVEDSIIRGTTTMARVKNIRAAGASEVHMLVSCPPHRFPCHYGIDFSTKGELIACDHRVEEIKNMLDLDTLRYLSIEGLLKSTKTTRDGFCLACFDGDYPVPIGEGAGKYCLER